MPPKISDNNPLDTFKTLLKNQSRIREPLEEKDPGVIHSIKMMSVKQIITFLENTAKDNKLPRPHEFTTIITRLTDLAQIKNSNPSEKNDFYLNLILELCKIAANINNTNAAVYCATINAIATFPNPDVKEGQRLFDEAIARGYSDIVLYNSLLKLHANSNAPNFDLILKTFEAARIRYPERVGDSEFTITFNTFLNAAGRASISVEKAFELFETAKKVKSCYPLSPYTFATLLHIIARSQRPDYSRALALLEEAKASECCNAVVIATCMQVLRASEYPNPKTALNDLLTLAKDSNCAGDNTFSSATNVLRAKKIPNRLNMALELLEEAEEKGLTNPYLYENVLQIIVDEQPNNMKLARNIFSKIEENKKCLSPSVFVRMIEIALHNKNVSLAFEFLNMARSVEYINKFSYLKFLSKKFSLNLDELLQIIHWAETDNQNGDLLYQRSFPHLAQYHDGGQAALDLFNKHATNWPPLEQAAAISHVLEALSRNPDFTSFHDVSDLWSKLTLHSTIPQASFDKLLKGESLEVSNLPPGVVYFGMLQAIQDSTVSKNLSLSSNNPSHLRQVQNSIKRLSEHYRLNITIKESQNNTLHLTLPSNQMLPRHVNIRLMAPAATSASVSVESVTDTQKDWPALSSAASRTSISQTQNWGLFRNQKPKTPPAPPAPPSSNDQVTIEGRLFTVLKKSSPPKGGPSSTSAEIPNAPTGNHKM